MHAKHAQVIAQPILFGKQRNLLNMTQLERQFHVLWSNKCYMFIKVRFLESEMKIECKYDWKLLRSIEDSQISYEN